MATRGMLLSCSMEGSKSEPSWSISKASNMPSMFAACCEVYRGQSSDKDAAHQSQEPSDVCRGQTGTEQNTRLDHTAGMDGKGSGQIGMHRSGMERLSSFKLFSLNCLFLQPLGLVWELTINRRNVPFSLNWLIVSQKIVFRWVIFGDF